MGTLGHITCSRLVLSKLTPTLSQLSLAEDVNTGTKYAVKEFSKTRLRKNAQSKMSFGFRGRGRGRGGAMAARPPAETDPFEHIKGEIAVMKKLDHPNIVKLYEVLDAPEHDSLYMVFELCGPAVMDVGLETEGEGVGEEKARDIMRQAVLGMEYRGFSIWRGKDAHGWAN